jgi:membrane-associated phospholipid phosphatase
MRGVPHRFRLLQFRGVLLANRRLQTSAQQLESTIVPLFAVSPFPSYPSNHSTFSAANSEILAYLFPTRAGFIRAVGKEGGDSRIWAAIHYQMDNVAGVQLGTSVAGVFTDWANDDGSHR